MSDEKLWHLTIHLLGQKPSEIQHHFDFQSKAKANTALASLRAANKPLLLTKTFHIENEKGEAVHFAGSQFISYQLKQDDLSAMNKRFRWPGACRTSGTT
jgi:hypothetical protein